MPLSDDGRACSPAASAATDTYFYQQSKVEHPMIRRFVAAIGLALVLTLVGSVTPASADVLVNAPRSQVCKGQGFRVGVWYQSFSGGLAGIESACTAPPVIACFIEAAQRQRPRVTGGWLRFELAATAPFIAPPSEQATSGLLASIRGRSTVSKASHGALPPTAASGVLPER